MLTRESRLKVTTLCLSLGACLIACGSKTAAAPPLAPAAQPAPVSLDKRVADLLRLEQMRVLQDPATKADLIVLLGDSDLTVRRRAALAIGRVGSADGVAPLIKVMTDPDEGLRASAAFALGLIADAKATAALEAALADTSPRVRGRAADALGLMGAKASARAVADSAGPCPALFATLSGDDEEYPKSPEIEACKLTVFALVRLGDFPQLTRVILNQQFAPVSTWWPIAFALQRSGNANAAAPLAQLLTAPGVYSRAFALRGLAALNDARVVAPAMAIVGDANADIRLRAAAIRALAQLKHRDAVPVLLKLLAAPGTPRNLVLESIGALGSLADPRAMAAMVDHLLSPQPTVRAAAHAAAVRIDPDAYLLLLSGAERDRDWSVRASLADVLTELPPDTARAALEELASDPDVRVQAPALRALARVGSPDLDRRMFAALNAPDFVLRATAATIAGDRKPVDGVARLTAAYVRGAGDAAVDARMAAIEAIAKYDGDEATATLRQALADAEWPVRLRAAALLRTRVAAGAVPLRPAPVRQPAAVFESDRLLRPSYSPQAFIETDLGTIQIELDVINAPFTSWSFVDLARAGFFNGIRIHRLIPNFVVQAGDPRGDGEGGAGYTIRDELNIRPFLRGTVGMALAGPETGGSQFFISVSPQPHLDGRYTVFGRVVRGLELLDRLSLGDVIHRITISDGS
jgi:cyclophilin family peptidyl-prolyl cis-trans isomerase/HEAT repeat protein